MYIGELFYQLIDEARRRVSAGIVTERQLARLCGLSQPHMHNVLKSFRSLSPESADRLMSALHIDIAELMFRFQKVGELGVRAVPLVRSRVGPGFDPVLTTFRGFVPFASTVVDSLKDPLVAQIAPDMGLPKPLMVNDIVLLDQNPVVRRCPGGSSLWLVAERSGARIRYVKLGGTRIYIANEITAGDPARWISVPLKGTGILARVVWFSRAMELRVAEERLDDVA